jgi:hypothetical protein
MTQAHDALLQIGAISCFIAPPLTPSAYRHAVHSAPGCHIGPFLLSLQKALSSLQLHECYTSDIEAVRGSTKQLKTTNT